MSAPDQVVTTVHVVITGTTGGIGAALAVYFVSCGWTVTGIDRERGPAGFNTIEADITDEAAMEDAFARAAETAPITAVIANAAVTDLDHHGVIDMPYDTWRRVLRVNVDGAFLTARCAARRMQETGGGNIVFVTSSLARLSDAQAGDAPYCTSKAAVEMLTRVLAIELAPLGINVNTLFPSVMIDTGFFAHWSQQDRARLAPPSLLNETAGYLTTLPPGAATGRSLDQQRWDDDPAYRSGWETAT